MRVSVFAVLALSLALVPASAATRHAKHHAAAHVGGGSWDGRWAGSWGGNDPTAVIVKGNHVVAYEYGGSTTAVSSSRVSARSIVYSGDGGVVVSITRTGANSAHATIKSSQGTGTAELTR